MPTFFETPNDFRKWLEKHHSKETELILAYFKKATGKPSINWPESVDQALCFGWIDGIRRKLDDEVYTVRFTPRKPTSNWSRVNIARIKQLKKEGLVTKTGWDLFKNRDPKKSGEAVHEQKNITLPSEYQTLLKRNPKAYQFFMNGLTPGYRKQSIWWVISAKKEETKERRMSILIECSEKKEKIPPLKWTK